MTRRPGMSLTEVLVALFILTIGVIGILTMFPLGAAQMARAVRDDRSALAAENADAFMRWYWKSYVVPDPLGLQTNPTGTTDAFFLPPASGNPPYLGGLFDNPALLAGPQYKAVQFASLPPLAQVNATQVNYTPGLLSYPVIVDPMGLLARPNYYFGDSPNFSMIPRCSLAIVPTISANPNLQAMFAYRSCSLTDSLGYYDNGYPTNDLEMRYNWFWVLQRPQFINEVSPIVGVNGVVNSNVPNQQVSIGYAPNMNLNLYTANMTVVVFDRRTLLYPPSNVPGFEVVFTASFTSGLTNVTLNLTAADQALDLKPGSWVMDATINPNAVPFPIRQAQFYRVVSITQINATQVNLELQSPVSPPTGYSPLGFTWTGTLVALKGVSGVFVRPQLTWN